MPKPVALFFVLTMLFNTTAAQMAGADSLKLLLKKQKVDSARADLLCALSDVYMHSYTDTALLLAQEALFASKRAGYTTGEMTSLKHMADAYEVAGNYPQALRFYIERLKLDEQQKEPEYTAATLLSVAGLYQLDGDSKNALDYSQKAIDYIKANKLNDYLWYSYNNMGDLYEKLNDLPHSLYLNNLAYHLATAKKDTALLGMSLNNLGNTFAKAGKADSALALYFAAIPCLKSSENFSFLCESYQGIARIYLKKDSINNALSWAKQSLLLAEKGGFTKKYITSAGLIMDAYKAGGRIDSAFDYQTKMIAMKDSVYSHDRITQLDALTMDEKLRQKEIAEQQARDIDERHHKMNLLLLGLCIPLFFLFSVFLSKRKIHGRIIEFSGILSLLMLFEYLTLLLHPWVSEITHHSPFLEIIILVALAAFLTPSHHRIEHWMLHKLTKHHKPKHNPQPVPPAAPPDEPADDTITGGPPEL